MTLTDGKVSISGRTDVKDLISQLRTKGRGARIPILSLVPALPIACELVCTFGETNDWIVDVMCGGIALMTLALLENGNELLATEVNL